MKTTFLDFVLSGTFITAFLAGTVAFIWFVVAPCSKPWLAEYHVVADVALGLIVYGLLSALAVRLMLKIRPLRPGEYSMDSPTFTYWKLISVVYRLGQWALKPFTPVFLKPLVVMLFGARVGGNVAFGGTIDDPFLVSIGPGVVLGEGSLVSGNVIADGKLVLGEVRIGAGAMVGVHSVVLPGSDIGPGALLVGGSILLAGTTIPAGETWRGNPARRWTPAPAPAAAGQS